MPRASTHYEPNAYIAAHPSPLPCKLLRYFRNPLDGKLSFKVAISWKHNDFHLFPNQGENEMKWLSNWRILHIEAKGIIPADCVYRKKPRHGESGNARLVISEAGYEWDWESEEGLKILALMEEGI